MSENRKDGTSRIPRARALGTPSILDDETNEVAAQAVVGNDLVTDDGEPETVTSDLATQVKFDNPDDAELEPEAESIAAIENMRTQIVLDNPDDGDLYPPGEEPGVGGEVAAPGKRGAGLDGRRRNP